MSGGGGGGGRGGGGGVQARLGLAGGQGGGGALLLGRSTARLCSRRVLGEVEDGLLGLLDPVGGVVVD